MHKRWIHDEDPRPAVWGTQGWVCCSVRDREWVKLKRRALMGEGGRVGGWYQGSSARWHLQWLLKDGENSNRWMGVVGRWGAKIQNRKAQGSSGAAWVTWETKTAGWAGFMVGVQAWKIEGSQIVRSLNFHTPETDFSCPRAAESQG